MARYWIIAVRSSSVLASAPSVGPHRDGVRRAVVFHHAGVSDGDIRGALFKAVLGIAAGLEERSDQVVGFSDRGLGVIDEAGLHGLPLGDESLPLGGAEFADFSACTRVSRSASFASALCEEPCSRTARSYSVPKRLRRAAVLALRRLRYYAATAMATNDE
jgi:hypothetical protein